MEHMNQREVWDKISKSWSERREEVEKDVSSFLSGKAGKVIDIGCGSGRNMFKSSDLKFYGVDFSGKMIRLAEEKAGRDGINFDGIVRDAWDTRYSPDFFDYGIFCSALSCIVEPEDRMKSLKELYRVLKPDGKAVIRVWSRNQKRIKNRPVESYVPWTVGKNKIDRYYYIYTMSELRGEIEAAGFVVLDSFEDDNIVFRVRKTGKDDWKKKPVLLRFRILFHKLKLKIKERFS